MNLISGDKLKNPSPLQMEHVITTRHGKHVKMHKYMWDWDWYPVLFVAKRPEASNLQKKNRTNTVLLARDHTAHYLNFLQGRVESI